ncbi:30S ribosomal protein S1 [Candidatus Riesia pediculicola]|uniref:30S ribosomal protein S1 n=1 Tax=Riesia pediculicola (strain USDA) TaxID=515618 RepID=D4G803_RIEPU|nr:30S ribosomal protein S1 [Candidatus Riesia pediculicola]ADD79752.1 ribosomal protein S1 [Candidatus Riesia pediculicola USDA]ARC53713.1 30S ribosomal protein S1 [Candidatus Riesia pediculicola]QOJ86355.1 30S ribosomal protein S1 [Candidatus Riesia pediculicola]
MNQSFSQLFRKSLKDLKIRSGSLVQGKVINIEKDTIIIDTGLKSESFVPIGQFKDSKGKIEVNIGDTVDVILETIEDGFGETVVSREKAKRNAIWTFLKESYSGGKKISGIITEKVKGGFAVEIEGIRAFLPGSLFDVRPIRDFSSNNLEGKEIEFKIIKLDQRRNNIVVSRKAIIESENNNDRISLLESLKEGIEVPGIVKNLTDYGAFIDLGGVDGLLHITDISWKRVKHPSEIVKIGDNIKVKVLKFDKDKSRVSLGLKQLGIDPWKGILEKYSPGKKIVGKVTNITDYGCFVEIEEGIEGLVHVSEIDWTKRNIHPSKIVNIGEEIKVMILDIDEKRRRISLGLKQCQPNPWKQFSEAHSKNDRVEGKIKSITDFGIFIELNGGIDGLVHSSDVSWDNSYEEESVKYKKGDLISAVVLQVDFERERISLGIKQLSEDPIQKYSKKYKKGDKIFGKVISIEEKEVIISLENKILGKLYVPENVPENYQVGKQIPVKYIGIDRKSRMIIASIYEKFNLSIEKERKVCENHEKKERNKFSNIMIEAFKAAKNE